MTAPHVSVLIPVYNREALIGPCIESALAQTFSDFEIIVCDNASTDGTWDACRHYAAANPRVRALRNGNNIGPVRNWARCIGEARGLLGKMLFSDDLLAPEYLEKTMATLADSRVGFVFTAAASIDESGTSLDQVAYDWPQAPRIVSSDRYVRSALLTDQTPVSPGAALFRMEDLRRNLRFDVPSPSVSGFTSTGAGPDLLLYLLTASAYPCIAHLEPPLCRFRTHPSSITLNMSERVREQYLQARVWFAHTHGYQRVLRHLLRRAWADECERTGGRPAFKAFRDRYLMDSLSFHAEDLWLATRYGFKAWRRRRRRARSLKQV